MQHFKICYILIIQTHIDCTNTCSFECAVDTYLVGLFLWVFFFSFIYNIRNAYEKWIVV